MAVENLIYQGINRAVSDYTGARACEELINLRPTEGGLAPVKDFTAKFSNVDWDRVFVHYTTSGPKYIVVKHTSSAVNVYYLTNAADPTSLASLFNVTGLSGTEVQDVIDHLYFAAAGNVILFSINAAAAGKYENHSYTWKFDETSNTLKYVEMEANAPNVTYSISSTIDTASTSIARLDGNSEKQEIIDSVQAGLNAIQEENPELCFGPVIIAIAFKTTDGQTFWTGGWKVYDPAPVVSTDNRFYLDANSSWVYNSYYVDKGFYTTYGHAYSMIPLVNSGTQGGFVLGHLKSITVPGTKVTLTFPAVSGWDKDTSIIQSVEVYASKPALYLDVDASGDGYEYNHVQGSPVSGDISTLLLPQKKYEDMELGNQILYYQTSIEMASLAEAAQTVKLSFGGNIQITEDILDADAGALQRYGQILSYNARFHYFDSVAKIKIEMPSFNFGPRTYPTLADTDVFVRYADDDQSGLIYLDTVDDMEYISPAYFVVAPSLNIKEVITCAKVTQGNTDTYYIHRYRMNQSSTYNYSYCEDFGTMETPSSPDAELQQAKTNTTDVVTNVETDAINVTEQYNPFVFKVEHSYKAPGNIIDVQPQMAGVVDASYGRDPLNVFTERGLYALTQGSANVLYGAFLPLSNLKASKGGIPVESGTFFLADGNLWLVSGRKVTLISEALTLGPHKYIRSCNGYKKLSGTDTNYSPTPVVSNPVYDVSPYLSQVEFKTFVNGDATQGISAGQLSYNRYRMELFVSNKSYDYSYVLSLKNWQWHKVSRQVWQDEPGSTVINVPGSTTGTISILDMSSEVSSSDSPMLIHFQSRPFSMGYQYSHVHRIVAMARAMLASAGNKLTVGLYGSEDLQHWTLLSYGKWNGKTETAGQNTTNTPLYLSQMRIPSAARSWRYYVICVGGSIPVTPDFPIDLGPVLVDYEPVVRRIG